MQRSPVILALVLSPALWAADFSLDGAVNRTGLDLYQTLSAKQPDGNLVLSPYSIASALALAYAGAEGVTRAEMAAALHLPDDEIPMRAAFANLSAAFGEMEAKTVKSAASRSRSGGTVHAIVNGKKVDFGGEPVGVVELHSANRLFGQRGYGFRDSFLNVMRNNYAAPLETLEFLKDQEGARATINQWVLEQTHDRIRDLIPAGGVKPGTRLVLANALYFKAPWAKEFSKRATRPEPFHFAAGDACEVPTMRSVSYLPYAHEDGFTRIALVYLASELQFLILLPDEDTTVSQVAAKLTPANFARWANPPKDERAARVALFLPKFRVQGATMALAEPLRAMGLHTTFTAAANFDRMAKRDARSPLTFDDIFHRTFIAVDEEGTEAAAASAMSMTLGAMVDRTPLVEVHVNRPFFFAIQHRPSGVCLFLGRIADPR